MAKTRIATPVSDFEKVPDWEIWTKFGLIALACLSVVYALGNLLVRLVLVLYRLVFGKVKSKQNRAWKWWHILTDCRSSNLGWQFTLAPT